jgi:hypothetical protein
MRQCCLPCRLTCLSSSCLCALIQSSFRPIPIPHRGIFLFAAMCVVPEQWHLLLRGYPLSPLFFSQVFCTVPCTTCKAFDQLNPSSHSDESGWSIRNALVDEAAPVLHRCATWTQQTMESNFAGLWTVANNATKKNSHCPICMHMRFLIRLLGIYEHKAQAKANLAPLEQGT